MRMLLHLRHGEREPAGVHLSERGVRHAAALGRSLSRFDRVVVSPKPRAVETAEAMGYEVDARLPELAGLPGPVERWLERESPSSFGDYVAAVEAVAQIREHAGALAFGWLRELDQLPEGGHLLLVSHAGVVELGAVGAVGRRARGWGPTLAPLEGVRLERTREGWQRAEVLRRPPEPPRSPTSR